MPKIVHLKYVVVTGFIVGPRYTHKHTHKSTGQEEVIAWESAPAVGESITEKKAQNKKNQSES